MTKKIYIRPSLRVIMIKSADIIAQSPLRLYSTEPDPEPESEPSDNGWGVQW